VSGSAVVAAATTVVQVVKVVAPFVKDALGWIREYRERRGVWPTEEEVVARAHSRAVQGLADMDAWDAAHAELAERKAAAPAVAKPKPKAKKKAKTRRGRG
jgi:hypothetical protein